MKVIAKLTKIEGHRDENDERKPCIKRCKEEDDRYEDVCNCWQNTEDYVTAKQINSITTNRQLSVAHKDSKCINMPRELLNEKDMGKACT